MTDGCDALDGVGLGWESAWLDGELSDRDAEAVRAHVHACGICSRRVADVRHARSLLRNLPVRRLPDDVRSSVPDSASVGAEPRLATPPRPDRRSRGNPGGPPDRDSRGRRTRRRIPRAAAAVAVVLGFVGGAAFALGGEPVRSDRVVEVPVEVFVADHLVRTFGGPAPTAALVEGAGGQP